jgi:hypothetical protein
MMIDTVELENFRAFGRKTTIPLAPITLLFGQNSAGKSSVLHALNLLKQTQESRQPGIALLPRAEEAICDLGSFRELVFDHDPKRAVTIGIGQSGTRVPRRWLREFGADRTDWFGLSYTFEQPADSAETTLAGLKLYRDNFDNELAAFQTRTATKHETVNILRRFFFMAGRTRPDHGARARLRVADCTSVSNAADLWEPLYAAWKSSSVAVVQELKEAATRLDEGRQRRLEFEEADEPAPSDLAGAYERAIAFYSSDFSCEQYVARMVEGLKGTTIAASGQHLFASRFMENGLPEFDAVDDRPGRRRTGPLHLPLPNLGMALMDVSSEVSRNLAALFPMGPFRRPPERWYIFTGTSPEDVGYKGQQLPDFLFRQPELVDRANEWLERLEVGYRLKVQSVGQSSSDLFELRLRDTRRGGEVDVALSDVGFGISQLLPFLVQSLAANEQIISIEQPEVHIHPRLQADLGDLIAETIRDPYNHQFIIETHSEHLMLRLQRLVRDGRIRCDDVSVVYVSRGETGSEAQRLRLDEEGDFIDEWPGGFFPERQREL